MAAFSADSFSIAAFSVNAWDFGDLTPTRNTVGGPPEVKWGYWIPSKYYDFSNPFGPYKSGDEQRAELAERIRQDSIKRGIIPDDTQVEASAALTQAALMAEAQRQSAKDRAAAAEAQARTDAAHAAYIEAYRRAYAEAFTESVHQELETLWAMELRARKIQLYNNEALALILAAAS